MPDTSPLLGPRARAAFADEGGADLITERTVWSLPPDVRGLDVVSALGERLGRASHVEADETGHPKWVVFTEEGAAGSCTHRVNLRFVRGVDGGSIRLAGPREGFHITRLMD